MAPILQLPNFQEQFNFTDASGVGIGAVLNQNQRPIAFVSLRTPEQGRKKLHSYGTKMISRALKLSEFNIEWEHRPGSQNVVAGVLSRNPVDNVEGSQISCAALRALALRTPGNN
ncbi:hypothetical protein TNCV_890771 [Trichonephila clavipes]|nr:hypothetical protein TNCV_890771 [Trichonephila clavipes]